MAKKYDASKHLSESDVSEVLPESLEAMTPEGTKTIRNLEVGDTIFSADGTPTKVVSVGPSVLLSLDCPPAGAV